MEKGREKKTVFLRLASLCLGILVALSVLVSGLFLYVEMDHDCEGEHCPVCEILAQCEKVLTGMKEVCCHTSVAAVFLCVSAAFVALASWVQVRPTPVSSKIQLNN